VIQSAEVVQVGSHFRMRTALQLTLHGQGASSELFSFHVLTFCFQNSGEIGHAACDLGVLVAQQLLPHLQGFATQRFGLAQVPLHFFQDPHVDHAFSDSKIMFAEKAFTNFINLLCQRERLIDLPRVKMLHGIKVGLIGTGQLTLVFSRQS